MARSSLTAQLASHILDHIRSNDLPRGQHLPSQVLADACRVSRAPINSAFKFLQNMGVVRFESNRGYFLAADANELAALKLLANEGGDEDDAYFEIAEDRLCGKLPAQVTESELMRHIGWDVGIAGTAEMLSKHLDAHLIVQRYSRLVIDCNRPPHVASSIPLISEATTIPGNDGISREAAELRRAEIFDGESIQTRN